MDTTGAIHTYYHSCHPSLLQCGFVPIITIIRFIYRCNCSEYFVMYWTLMTFHGHGFELVSGVAHTYPHLHTIEACMAMHTHMHQQLQLQLKTTSKTSSCKGEEK